MLKSPFMTDLLQQAIAAHQSNNLTDANRLYREVLAASPDNADALALLGLVTGLKGNHEEAIAFVQKAVALDPKSTLFRFHLGSVLMNAKKLIEASQAFRQSIILQPTFAPAYYNLGNTLRAMDDWSGALDAYQNAIKRNPNYPEAYNNLALTLVHEKKLEEALEQAKKAVEIAPNYGEGWRTVCNIAESVKQYALAVEAGEQCVRLMPESHYSWFGYGVALNRVDRHEEAIVSYKRALELKPERADIWDNLGQTYQSLNRLDEAEATFHKTIEVAGQKIANEDTREVAEEEYGNRHWHLALMELLRGKYKKGFARYRSRFKDVGGLQRRKMRSPVWKGEDLKGKTLLVTDEQGFGDTLMLCRYLPLIKKQGAQIVFSLHPVLRKYFADCSYVDKIVLHGEQLPPFDFHASVFDLPYIFGTTLETIPSDMPYLPTPAPDGETGLPKGKGYKVGVVWGGSPLHSNDFRRSIPLSVFSGLFDMPGVQFYSLNRDMKPGDTDLLPILPIIDLAPKLKDFDASARLIGQLDLVITVDTATAHLSGGMGKQVWVLLPIAPDWRWLTERSDNPWYPTVRLFRQSKAGNWASVIADVKHALMQKAR